MKQLHRGKQSLVFDNSPRIRASYSVVGKKEGEGPLRTYFDMISQDTKFSQPSWEKAESQMQTLCLRGLLSKAQTETSQIQMIFAGDLLNQCISTSFSLRDTHIPVYGLYGACSTMAESLALAAMTVNAGYADNVVAMTSSHFASAERQYRFPLVYGGQRTPTAQWTVTGSGSVLLSSVGEGSVITAATTGYIVDMGIKDANNMGAAMAPAACDTIKTHLEDLSLTPGSYDLILTGDLGIVGSEILIDLLRQENIDISPVYNDCGVMIFSPETQDTHAGGSGCGCSASVLCGHILNGMRSGRWHKVLFAATGALLSPTSTQQGESIPCISCAVALSTDRGI